MPPPVTLAAVIGAHGVAGEVRLKVFADDLTPHKSFNGGSLTLKSLRPTPQGAIARFAEVPDRTAAEALRGTELTVPRTALPPLGEGEYYHADLIGLPVETPNGAPIGRVVLVENFGAGDVLEIEKPDGKRFMVPMRPEAVPEWDAARLIVASDYIEQLHASHQTSDTAGEYLPAFGGAYLEDSYFLGFTAEGCDLALNMEFVLTTDHPAYEPPLPGQQHCYRSGLLVLEKPTVVDLLPVQLNKYAVTLDLDGTFDLGSLELYRLAPRRFRMLTQWFDMTVDVESLTLRLKGSIPLTA